MKSFVALALAGAASATLMDSVDYEFMKYITAHNKRYATKEEFDLRKELFKNTSQVIAEHNAKNLSSKMGHNKFSDWTEDEF